MLSLSRRILVLAASENATRFQAPAPRIPGPSEKSPEGKVFVKLILIRPAFSSPGRRESTARAQAAKKDFEVRLDARTFGVFFIIKSRMGRMVFDAPKQFETTSKSNSQPIQSIQFPNFRAVSGMQKPPLSVENKRNTQLFERGLGLRHVAICEFVEFSLLAICGQKRIHLLAQRLIILP